MNPIVRRVAVIELRMVTTLISAKFIAQAFHSATRSFYLSQSSNSIPRSVFSSRYFTITGV
jgi:hypothetical protein